MKQINLKKVIIAGITAGIVSVIYGTLTCGWLFKSVYQIEPVNVWKITESTGFSGSQIGLMIFGNLMIGIILAKVYALIKNCLPGDGIKKGLKYGLIVWLVGTVPGMFAIYMFQIIAPAVVLYWTVIFLIKFLILGAVIAKIYKE